MLRGSAPAELRRGRAAEPCRRPQICRGTCVDSAWRSATSGRGSESCVRESGSAPRLAVCSFRSQSLSRKPARARRAVPPPCSPRLLCRLAPASPQSLRTMSEALRTAGSGAGPAPATTREVERGAATSASSAADTGIAALATAASLPRYELPQSPAPFPLSVPRPVPAAQNAFAPRPAAAWVLPGAHIPPPPIGGSAPPFAQQRSSPTAGPSAPSPGYRPTPPRPLPTPAQSVASFYSIPPASTASRGPVTCQPCRGASLLSHSALIQQTRTSLAAARRCRALAASSAASRRSAARRRSCARGDR